MTDDLEKCLSELKAKRIDEMSIHDQLVYEMRLQRRLIELGICHLRKCNKRLSRINMYIEVIEKMIKDGET